MPPPTRETDTRRLHGRRMMERGCREDPEAVNSDVSCPDLDGNNSASCLQGRVAAVLYVSQE
ncbi:hypothetical protein PROFUN_03543 [Planoprotostelium fungivorum]|uniref:Uncharacterized protein n=1 Tax=Planoprotostelium fungivorum TaxID=1890364 RepID=A0A2P6MSD6_9EUKA|nr:hypothetical protein PROFUN_03543 [Planoprotostelium fungivorum]